LFLDCSKHFGKGAKSLGHQLDFGLGRGFEDLARNPFLKLSFHRWLLNFPEDP